MFPTASSSSSSSLAGLAAAFGKRKMFSFLFIHYTAHIATMYRLLLGRREPAMAVSTTCIFSLLFKDRVRQQVQ
jgi:hypothetical protein